MMHFGFSSDDLVQVKDITIFHNMMLVCDIKQGCDVTMGYSLIDTFVKMCH